ncbi:membrane protein insertase YidC [Lentilactobacillus senioris]|uniref:membrane protein insertase YidC n=1 Tax=Lentilactobacillus senioris TaxID=931534 RepID=UPI0022829332|nr:membrane protein insertase YidC [Lentilactobacillus senioris]MCY9806942.1 membrane protein insertase YidC [Lentilactobacillus senioris]
MKKFKRGATLSLLGGLALVLSGCVRTKNGHPYGFVYDYLAKPAQHVMEWLTQYVGSYGWAIIVLTVIVRMILLPMMVSQMKKSTIQQEKMQLVRPQMDIITKRQKAAKTQEEQAAASQQMMKLYRDNGISMTGGIGCLPLIIQMPIFAALYAAIRYSPELSHTVFMGIRLGETSWVLAVLSFLAYLLQGYLSMLGTPASQKKQMASMMLLSPIMILFFTMSAPAGLGLYFFIGGLFACVQTLIINLYRPKIRRDVEKEMGEIKQVVVDDISTPVSEEQEDHSLPATPKKNNRNRNAGKQHRDK